MHPLEDIVQHANGVDGVGPFCSASHTPPAPMAASVISERDRMPFFASSFQVANHAEPRLRIVMGAVNAHASHAVLHEIADQLIIRGCIGGPPKLLLLAPHPCSVQSDMGRDAER